MNLSGLARAYTLAPLQVCPSALLLDPRNPRLITDSLLDRSYTPEEVSSADVQHHVRELMCSREHDVKRLISSIQEMGFVGGLHEMIVKDIGNRGPYLVLEGNRRTAALQHLLRTHRTLRPEVRQSIESIQVKEFVYRTNADIPEDVVIEALLGSIHIDGPKEWGALERATYVHRSYLRTLGTHTPFRYDPTLARSVGAAFNMGPKAVHKCLTICTVYEQLRRASVDVEPRHYTLIDLATKTRSVAGPYFGLNSLTCSLSATGIERFVDLMLGDNPPVHNPRLFAEFVEVHDEGTPLELVQVASGEVSLGETCAAIRRRKARRAFRDDLEDIKRRIGELYVDEFRGTEGERMLIHRIKTMVDTRLVPLTRARS